MVRAGSTENCPKGIEDPRPTAADRSTGGARMGVSAAYMNGQAINVTIIE